MKVGCAQLDITPEPGVDLCGFARRQQPSTVVWDSLFCRALYLVDGDQKLLWLHADVIGFEASFVAALRAHFSCPCMVTATHTHSAPAIYHLVGCGAYEGVYVEHLFAKMCGAARLAMESIEDCSLEFKTSSCDLAIDRRGFPSGVVDDVVGFVGFRRSDGSYKAVLFNYAMHAVCYDGRAISADWPGRVAISITESLPGAPIPFVTIGACGNVNPPHIGASRDEVAEWGMTLANCAINGSEVSGDSHLSVQSIIVPLRMDAWFPDEIKAFAARYLQNQDDYPMFGSGFGETVRAWRAAMIAKPRPMMENIELFCVHLGPFALIGVNAEIFAHFTMQIRAALPGKSTTVFTVSYANGLIGYIPHREAYDEGGYEVESAIFFYNALRPSSGGLEKLSTEAVKLLGNT